MGDPSCLGGELPGLRGAQGLAAAPARRLRCRALHRGQVDEGGGASEASCAASRQKTTRSDPALPCPRDKVNRQFRAPAPNRLWVSDFTYVLTWQGFVVYVARGRSRSSTPTPTGSLTGGHQDRCRPSSCSMRSSRLHGRTAGRDAGSGSSLGPRISRRSQPVVATLASCVLVSSSSSASAGVFHPSVLRGLPLSAAATASSSSGP